MMDHVDLYCERTAAGLLAEPLNAASNAIFLVVAWLMWRRSRLCQGSALERNMMIGLLVAVGIGSGLFHSFANSFTQLLDVVPISLFTLVFMWIYCRRVLAIRMLPVAGLVAVVLAGNVLGRHADAILNGSLRYAPALILLFVFGLIHLTQGRNERYALLISVMFLAGALFFRSIDMAICPAWPHGTHFLWHLLAGGAYYFAGRGLLPNLPGAGRAA